MITYYFPNITIFSDFELMLFTKKSVESHSSYDFFIRLKLYPNKLRNRKLDRQYFTHTLHDVNVYKIGNEIFVEHIHQLIYISGKIDEGEIIVDCNNLTNEMVEMVSRFLTSTFLPIFLAYRGFITFHSSCLSKNNNTFALLADSGVGKSTLLFEFLRLGYDLIVDDLLTVSSNRTHYVILRMIDLFPKLYYDSISYYNLSDSIVGRNMLDGKFYINVDFGTGNHIILNKFFILIPDNNVIDIKVTKISMEESFSLLFKYVLGLWGVDQKRRNKLIKEIYDMIRFLDIYMVKFSKKFFSVSDISSAITEAIL